MTKRIEEEKGLVKVYWQNVRRYVVKANPIFAELVDKLNLPSDQFPLYIARYAYGASLDDEKGAILPNEKGKLHRLSDIYFNNDVMSDLGYGKNSLPLGMILDKQMEYFLNLKNRKLTAPMIMYKPGMFCSIAPALNQNKPTVSNIFLNATAGARSAIMLPNITASDEHIKLKRHLNIEYHIPKLPYDHGLLFKEISENAKRVIPWRLEILYFSNEWIKCINSNSAWAEIKAYLGNALNKVRAFETNYLFYTFLFSSIQIEYKLKPNPFLVDIAHWLFAIASGEAPGYAPAVDEDAIPLHTLQHVYTRIYGLKKHHPIIIIPQYFDWKINLPVYYPMQYPPTPRLSPSTRGSATTLTQMRALKDLMKILIRELSKNFLTCKDNTYSTMLYSNVAQNSFFTYFHCDNDIQKIIENTSTMLELDNRFMTAKHVTRIEEAELPKDTVFLRGCIRIKSKV